MKRLLFSLQDMGKRLASRKYLNSVLLLVIAVALFFPLIAVNDIQDMQMRKRFGAYRDVEQLSIVNVVQQYIDGEEMEKALQSAVAKGTLSEAAYSTITKQIVYTENQSFSMSVGGITEEYMEFSGYRMISGAFFTEEEMQNGERVCLLAHGGLLERMGVSEKDEIEILGNSYVVRGIVYAPKVHGGVLLPYESMQELVVGENIQHRLMVYAPEKKNIASVMRQIFSESMQIDIEEGVEAEQAFAESITKWSKRRILEASLLIAFSVFVLAILMKGKNFQERYTCAVRIVMGATLKREAFGIVVQNLILMTIAFLMDIVSYPYIMIHVNGCNRHLQQMACVDVYIGGVILTVLCSLVSFRHCFREKSMAALLGEQK